MIPSPERRQAAQAVRFGAEADALLACEGLVVDADSRARLVEAVAAGKADASLALFRMAGGDYSPDPKAARFPAWQRPDSPAPKPRPTTDGLTVGDLYGAWSSYHADKRAASTVRRYGPSLRSLFEFTKGRAAASLTGDDVYAWAVHRRDKEEVAPRVINKNDLVAVSSVYRWAMSRQGGQIVPGNPVAGISLDEPRAVVTRERAFREAEVRAILQAANAVEHNEHNPTLAWAWRWYPWLAAYSGARIVELTGLDRADIRHEGAVPVMDFTRTKTGEPRTVPLHPHLVEMGFLRFVESRPEGPLFFDPSRHQAGRAANPAQLRGAHVAKWVRENVKLDADLDPNHGWRHTWKTRALGAGIEERLRDAITGHAVASVGRRYESPPLSMLAEAMSRFPRYVLAPV